VPSLMTRMSADDTVAADTTTRPIAIAMTIFFMNSPRYPAGPRLSRSGLGVCVALHSTQRDVSTAFPLWWTDRQLMSNSVCAQRHRQRTAAPAQCDYREWATES